MASASNQPDNPQGQEEKMSAVELAYKDQGYHEMEFTTGDEYELEIKKKQCKKNPGHPFFIKARDFTIEHLPERWRDSLVFDYITALIGLTVRLAVKYTSEDRPPNYPLYKRRGQYGVTAYGSGWVCTVDRKFTKKDGRTCPCTKCQESPHLAKTQWGKFCVWTAKHVVFNSSEARCTRCDLFFDSDDNYNHPSLEGVEVATGSLDSDYIIMVCITHDEDVCSKLEEMRDRSLRLRDKVREKYKTRSSDYVDVKKTVVVISHPHGLCKHLTVGEMTHTPPDGWGKCKYSAETCQGSSGGLVCILGDWDIEYHDDDEDSEHTEVSEDIKDSEDSEDSEDNEDNEDSEDKDDRPYVTRSTTHSGCKQKGQNESITGLMWFA